MIIAGNGDVKEAHISFYYTYSALEEGEVCYQDSPLDEAGVRGKSTC